MAEVHAERRLEYRVQILTRRRLSQDVYELRTEKPDGFTFQAGQKVLLGGRGIAREYSLACGTDETELVFCFRRIINGEMSSFLAQVSIGQEIEMSKPYGFLLHRPGKSVFLATGTGVAPFVAYVKSGVRDFIVLHGVTRVSELYYRDLLSEAASLYLPCLSRESKEVADKCGGYNGRVTEYLARNITGDDYDFYLCGNGSMIHDAILLIDRKYPQSRVFTETFFASENS